MQRSFCNNDHFIVFHKAHKNTEKVKTCLSERLCDDLDEPQINDIEWKERRIHTLYMYCFV